MDQARHLLRDWQQQRQPQFVPCDLRALDGLAAPSSGKTTDFYLANLAGSHAMQWATLDEVSGHTAAFVIPKLGEPASPQADRP